MVLISQWHLIVVVSSWWLVRRTVFWSLFGSWRGQCAYTLVPVQLLYTVLTCRVVGTFPCGYHTAPMWLTIQLISGSDSWWWGIPMFPPYSSSVVLIQPMCGSHTTHVWLLCRLVGAFLCSCHTAHWWLPYGMVGALSCDYHTAPMWLSFSSHVVPIQGIGKFPCSYCTAAVQPPC